MNKSLKVLEEIIVKLEDDLQHYTMVDKDKVKSKYIKLEIEDYKQVLRDLERLEKLENYPPEFDGFLYSFEGLIERNKKLETENQELKEELEINETLSNAFEKQAFEVVAENEKRKEAIEILKDKIWVNKAVNYRICWKNDTLNQQEYDLLKEVLENVD